MAGITNLGTTFNLPNFVGELFSVTPEDTPFLSAIGGLTGGEATNSTLFQWQGYDLRDASASRQRLEGAAAPTAEARTRTNVTSVVEIHQEAVEISYTKLASTGQYASTGSTHTGAVGLSGANPVTNELDWQLDQALKQIARDIEKSFIVGSFNNPSSNNAPRRTRGIMEATSTNVHDGGTTVGIATIEADDEKFTISSHGLSNGDAVTVSSLTGGAVDVLSTEAIYYVVNKDTSTFQLATTPGGSAITFDADGGAVVKKCEALTDTVVEDLMQQVWENGGIQETETATIMVGATMKRGLTELFIKRRGYEEATRNIAGVSVSTIETDFGRLNVMLNRHMPRHALQIVSLEECTPVFLMIPGKGFLFVEELARVGASEPRQIYGEVGLKYGNERKHGKLVNMTSPAASS